MRVQHHLLLCATPSRPQCCDPSEGAASWATLKQLVAAHGLDEPARPEGVVLRTKADCLRLCAGGPILLVWPEGIWYGQVSPQRLERIVEEHLIGGRVIEEWVVRRTPFEPRWPPETDLGCTPGPPGLSPGMSLHFDGTLEELKALVAGLGEPGHWIHGGPFDEFLFDGGERLNWWSSSGQLTLVGHPTEIQSLRERLLDRRPDLQGPLP